MGRLRPQPRRARRPRGRHVRRPVHLRAGAHRGGQGHAGRAARDLDPRVGERRRRAAGRRATPRRSAARTAWRRSSGCRTSCAASPTSGGPRRRTRPTTSSASGCSSRPTPTALASINATARGVRRDVPPPRRRFPREARDGGYEDRIKQTYPIHPELFDRLYEDWSSLERFQRTRGVLRLMNTVIHALWVGEDQSPLIMPGVDPARRPRR